MKVHPIIAVTAALFSLSATTLVTGAADDRALRNAAYQASAEQEQLRAQTRRLVESISAMLEEFRRNPAAAEEVALAEATLKRLTELGEDEMAAVVTALREASKAPDDQATSPEVLVATKSAKEIQLTLTRLADRLALYQDEASMELRVIALIRRQLANQRQTKYLAEGIPAADQVQNDTELTTLEQKAISEECGQLMQTLGRLSSQAPGTGREAMGTVQSSAAAALLVPHGHTALSLLQTKDFPGAQAAQGKVVEALQKMLLALNARKSQEERLRAAEQRLRGLAARQEALARTTTKSGLPHHRSILRRQQEIADQFAIPIHEIFQLINSAGPLLGETRQGLETLDSTLRRHPEMMDRPGEKLQITGAQEQLAARFLEIAELLKKQGDIVARQNQSAQGGSESDAAREALSDAASSVMDAMGHMDKAQQLMNQGGDADAARQQMDAAQGDLAEAQNQLGDAGANAPEGAGENLSKSQDSLGEGQSQSQQGGEGLAKSSASVSQAHDSASKALEQMRQALSTMPSQSVMMTGGQAQNPSQAQSEGSGGGAGWGSLFRHNSDHTSFSAQATLSEEDRAALSTLQQEKAPPEYDTMARQYLKNLADGVVPAQ